MRSLQSHTHAYSFKTCAWTKASFNASRWISSKDTRGGLIPDPISIMYICIWCNIYTKLYYCWSIIITGANYLTIIVTSKQIDR
jgi:hypothetical protein